jgi:hypothetical protein
VNVFNSTLLVQAKGKKKINILLVFCMLRKNDSFVRRQQEDQAAAAVTRLFRARQQQSLRQTKLRPGGRPPWQESFASKATSSSVALINDNAEVGALKSAQFSGNEDSSRFMVALKKQSHSMAIPAEAKSRLQNTGEPSLLERHEEFNKAIAIRRHEEGLSKRRVLDSFLSLTGAQQDLHLTIPSQSYAQEQLSGSSGRDVRTTTGGQWALNNSYRQQLDYVSGVPEMTCIMRGDYCRAQQAAPVKVTNFVESNKRHVKAASIVSHMFPVGPEKRHNVRKCQSAGTARSQSALR